MLNQSELSVTALHDQPEWLRVTLSSIGDAVITTDNDGNITFLNPVAQTLTGWSLEESVGKPLESVFRIINEQTRKSVESPTVRALRDGVIVGLANHTLLISKDGTERPIDDSAAPIRNAAGDVAGVVLIFRDVTERNRQEHLVRDALTYADDIIATIREPFLVLDTNLRVVSANRSFYEDFQVAEDETRGRFIYDLGNRQWDIPRLRTLLEEVLPQSHDIQDFEVTHAFPTLGQKIMLLNARRIRRPGNHSELILLSIQDATERRHVKSELRASKQRMRLATETTGVGIWEWNVITNQIHWDAEMFRIYGVAPTEDGLVAYETWSDAVLPEDLPRQEEFLQETVRQLGHSSRAFRIRRGNDGECRHIQCSEAVRTNDQGEAEWVVGTNLDVTVRKRSDALLAAQKKLLELSASEACLGEVFDHMVCAVQAHFGDESRVSMFLFEPDGLHLRFVASAGQSKAYIRAAEQLEVGSEMPCNTAAFTGRPIFVSDVNQDSHWAPYLKLANEHGIGAVWSYPMKLLDGKVLGTLAIYHKTSRVPGPEELDAVQLLSQTVALVIERSRESLQRKAAEVAVRASEVRLRLILDSMPQKVFTTTPEGEINYFNRQWLEFTGLTIEQLQDSGWTHLVHPDDLDQKTQHWNHSFATGEPFQSEHRFQRADGEYRWHISWAVPIHDESGQISMWVGKNTDVHDTKQTEMKLRVSEVRYRRLFETAKDGILILDFATGKIVDANPFMSDLLGYSLTEFSGKELWEIGLFGDKSANEAASRDLQEHGYLRYEHLPLESEDGRRVEVEIVANSYREDDHSVIQYNIRDITDRSHLEQQLRGQASELSDLHRRKDEFLAMLSHELRSPLAPIANAVQLLGLQQGNESRIQQQARAIIERQLRQLQHLVDDLLEVSRITTGRVQLRLERTTVGSIVTSAIETVRPLITQRRHDLTVNAPAEPIWLLADAGRLEQVLVNLLSNAAKYTEESGHIWLTVELEGEGGEWRVPSGANAATSGYSLATHFVLIRIRDTGVGIDPSLLPRIFDLFTQAERSLDRSQGGLGIGLALVHRLTELHGGTVESHSTLGFGSEFVVRLPLAPTDTHESASQVTEINSPTTRPLRVLVVDDNVDTVLSFSMLLEAHGHEVRTAHDGIAAVKAAIEFRPDVALLDIGLPGLNGYEVARRIRLLPELKHVVLVALTGYGQDSDRKTSLEAGFNHHLVKPAILEQLLQILTTASEQVK